MVSKDELIGLLVIRLSDADFLEHDTATAIRNKLGFVIETANISQLLIDLQDVPFMSSDAIGQLMMVKKKCNRKGIALALCNISADNMKVLRLVHADKFIDIFEDKQAALESLAKSKSTGPLELLSDEAITELTNRAESGDLDAIYELAWRKADGNGVAQDFTGALGLYEKAANEDHVQAQFELATCHAFGLGVHQDYGNAIPWYEKAAEQGHADAQYMLGMSFQYSLNGDRDLVVAKKWYDLAAAQGHEKAKLALQEMPAE
jgi:anti-anti-sigma factor